jgi:2-amino-4-hydroxy-6-hydroxymethyldihydropteridine diphosphokinase
LSLSEKPPTSHSNIGRRVWLCFGANLEGNWGLPGEAIERALREIAGSGLTCIGRSSRYRTSPVGLARQPEFVNVMAAFAGSIAPGEMLRLAKRLERMAGRRLGLRNGPRPLDIDIIDHGGRVVGGSGRARAVGRLLLPHPECAKRGFVLVPLAEAGPAWRHPRLGLRAGDLLRRNPHLRRGVVRWAERDLPIGAGDEGPPAAVLPGVSPAGEQITS